jgi:hypothetical protein
MGDVMDVDQALMSLFDQDDISPAIMRAIFAMSGRMGWLGSCTIRFGCAIAV